jgi:hypothetical protein
VLVSIAECPLESRSAYRPWFDAILASLEIRDPSKPGADRDYWSGVSDPNPSPRGSP